MIDETLRLDEAGYSARFKDPAFGLELGAAVAARAGLRGPLTRKVEGSNLVFRTAAGTWLKISPPFFGDAFDAELAATRLVQGRLPVAIPDILDAGAFEDWRYLVSAHVPGTPIQDVLGQLGEADLERIAAALGGFIAAFNAAPPAGFERSFGPWPRYLEGRLADMAATHAAKEAPPTWIGRIGAFVAGQAAWLRMLGPPVLIHADLTAEHVMLSEGPDGWRLSGVLDLADAMVAPAALDLVAPLLELFRGRRSAQRRLAATAGVAIGEPFSERMMAVALQHRFLRFAGVFAPEIAAGARSMAEIARAAFPESLASGRRQN